MSLGPRIAKLRKAHGWTQAELAKRARISASAVAMYETGRRVPDGAALERIAEALGVSAEELARDAATRVTTAAEASPAGKQPEPPPPDSEAAALQPKPTMPSDRRAQAATSRRAAPQPVTKTPAAAQVQLPSDEVPALSLSREEAAIILFLRANPTCLPFVESYIRADPREREQLARTWRLIRDFQSYGRRPDGSP
ncbi:MAG: helix-turn-helix domain-containing protein [Alicyclobacillaceae bacterium]|nr:helix-turn-helix domain-containing protein [Alicyclobacillaceae bacterium]